MLSPTGDDGRPSTVPGRRTSGRVDVLGTVTVHAPDGPVPIAGRANRCLLALLALHRGRPVDATGLVERVWGDAPPEHASAQLRRSVRDLVQAIGAAGPRIVGDGTWFSLDAAPGATDLDQFRRSVATGRRLLARGRPARAAAVLERAVGLWAPTSPFLGPDSDPWPEAAELREERINAVEDHAAALIAAGRPEDAVEPLDRVARDHPLRESLAVLRIRALARAGHPARALDVYAEIERGLEDTLGLDPGAELTQEVVAVRAPRPSSAFLQVRPA